jgi:hypothetical protein
MDPVFEHFQDRSGIAERPANGPRTATTGGTAHQAPPFLAAMTGFSHPTPVPAARFVPDLVAVGERLPQPLYK